MNSHYKLGITRNFPCNYLADQDERLLVVTDERLQNSQHYSWLMSQGFRRSGEQIYRPYCVNCSACQSIRVLTDRFSASKSQKRLLNKTRHLRHTVATEVKLSYYPLFKMYIDQLHSDGAMFPANKKQFVSFLGGDLTEQVFIETWHNEELIAVAITDVLADALSAVYTFYDPSQRKNGLGVYSILQQIELANKMAKPYLYLGYQIDQCKKMNYKNRYFPYQQLIENNWKTINK